MSGGLPDESSFTPSRTDELLDDPMPEELRRRVYAYRFQVRDAKQLAGRIKTRYAAVPYVWSLLVASGTAVIACAVQVFVGDRSEPKMADSVRDMYMLGCVGFGAAALVLIAWWLVSRKERASDLDDLCRKLDAMDYPVPQSDTADWVEATEWAEGRRDT